MDWLRQRAIGQPSADALVVGFRVPPERLKRLKDEVDVETVAGEYRKRPTLAEQNELRATKLQDPLPEGAGGSVRWAILEILYRLNANAGVNPELLGESLRAVGITASIDTVLARVWDHQKQGFVTFAERKSKHGSSLHRIRLTRQGKLKAIENRGGVEIERAPRAAPKSSRPLRIRSATHEEVEVVKVDDLVPPLIGEPQQSSPPEDASRADLPQTSDPHMELPPDTPTQYPVIHPGSIQAEHRLADAMLMGRHPEIYDLVVRRAEHERNKGAGEAFLAAAEALEPVDPFEAQRLMDRASELAKDPFSPLERAVLSLIDELRAG